MSKDMKIKSKVKEVHDRLIVKGNFERKVWNKGSSNRENKFEKKDKDKINKKCFQCQKEGHFKIDCPERKFKKKNKSNEDMANASIVTNGYLCAEVLMATTSLTQEEWVLDTGYSYHMTTNKD